MKINLLMKLAADENPTENCVFDVTLLLEKILADFEGFKAQVKTIIFDLLTFEVNLLFSTISDNKLADFVWTKVNEYGFGSIERIIDWFSVESRQDKLAQVILGDTNLQVEMNLNTPDNPSYDPDIGLQYAAVAKAGILVFTDYIHDTYIAGGTSWVQSMWGWLMGQLGRSGDTLVDIVADIFTGVSSALQTIKDNVGEFVDGVKDGMEYILESLMTEIAQGIGEFLKEVIISIGKILLSIFPNLPIILLNEGISINGNIIQIVFTTRAFKFQVGNLLLDIENLFFNGDKSEIETLTINTDPYRGYYLAGKAGLLATLLIDSLPLTAKFVTFVASGAAYVISQFLALYKIVDTSIPKYDREIFKNTMMKFHLMGAIGHLLSFLITKAFQNMVIAEFTVVDVMGTASLDIPIWINPMIAALDLVAAFSIAMITFTPGNVIDSVAIAWGFIEYALAYLFGSDKGFERTALSLMHLAFHSIFIFLYLLPMDILIICMS